MRRFFMLILLSLTLISSVFADTRTLKTYTPFTPQEFYNYNYRNNKFVPPPPPPNYYRYRNHNGYVSPYYNNYTPKRSVFKKVSDFFSTGQMTGYTTSNSLDSDYGYQNYTYDDFGNYKYDNYGQQNNATIELLD